MLGGDCGRGSLQARAQRRGMPRRRTPCPAARARTSRARRTDRRYAADSPIASRTARDQRGFAILGRLQEAADRETDLDAGERDRRRLRLVERFRPQALVDRAAAPGGCARRKPSALPSPHSLQALRLSAARRRLGRPASAEPRQSASAAAMFTKQRSQRCNESEQLGPKDMVTRACRRCGATWPR